VEIVVYGQSECDGWQWVCTKTLGPAIGGSAGTAPNSISRKGIAPQWS